MSKNYLQQRDEFIKAVKKKEERLAKLNSELSDLENKRNELENEKNKDIDLDRFKVINGQSKEISEQIEFVKQQIDRTISTPPYDDAKFSEYKGTAFTHCNSIYKSLLNEYISSSENLVNKGEEVLREIRSIEDGINELLPPEKKILHFYPDTIQFNAIVHRLKGDIKRIKEWLEANLW